MHFTTKRQSVRDPDLGLEEIIGMIKTIFINHSERSLVLKRSKESYRKVHNSGRESRTDSVRESAMYLTCHNCKRPGHTKKDCKELMGKPDEPNNVESGTWKWCSYHHSDEHSNENCYQQQQSGKSGARLTRAELTRMTSAITREMVAVSPSLTVKVRTIKRSLRTVT